ncbi:MAG: hypothetical protein H0V70_29590 [Ktedonobacteraceae bacterium]|nr:hypothetical protein [Ktedonobacteraceae bacterium]
MSQLNGEHPSSGNGKRTTLVVVVASVIAVLAIFMVYSHFPSANPAQGTFNDFTTPIATANHPVSSVTVDRSVTVSGLQLTITHAQQAGSFSDARKHTGRYTVRVYLQAHNAGQDPIDVDFIHRIHLILPGGQVIAPQVLAIAPLTMPKASQAGFIDFPLQNIVQLEGTMVRFDAGTLVPLTAQ